MGIFLKFCQCDLNTIFHYLLVRAVFLKQDCLYVIIWYNLFQLNIFRAQENLGKHKILRGFKGLYCLLLTSYSSEGIPEDGCYRQEGLFPSSDNLLAVKQPIGSPLIIKIGLVCTCGRWVC